MSEFKENSWSDSAKPRNSLRLLRLKKEKQLPPSQRQRWILHGSGLSEEQRVEWFGPFVGCDEMKRTRQGYEILLPRAYMKKTTSSGADMVEETLPNSQEDTHEFNNVEEFLAKH